MPIRSRGDRAQLPQALFNIVKNAIEAMLSIPADQRKLTVSTRVQDHSVVLNVRHTGAGIPQRANIFDAFFTTKPTYWDWVSQSAARSFSVTAEFARYYRRPKARNLR
jgi:C4-dicarboxylate-specific signal transduction histidine kinase